RLQPAQHPVGAPVLGQFDRRAHQVAGMLLQLAVEAFEQGEGIGRAAGESGDDLAVVQPAHLARTGLDDGVAQGDLAVTTQRDLVAAPYRYDCRHWIPSSPIGMTWGSYGPNQ